MTNGEKQEVDAALEYCKINAEPGIDKKIYDAFMAGMEWQKHRPKVKPDKEYYGG